MSAWDVSTGALLPTDDKVTARTFDRDLFFARRAPTPPHSLQLPSSRGAKDETYRRPPRHALELRAEREGEVRGHLYVLGEDAYVIRWRDGRLTGLDPGGALVDRGPDGEVPVVPRPDRPLPRPSVPDFGEVVWSAEPVDTGAERRRAGPTGATRRHERREAARWRSRVRLALSGATLLTFAAGGLVVGGRRLRRARSDSDSES